MREYAKYLIRRNYHIEALPGSNEDGGKDKFRCKECNMEFSDKIRLERHFRAANPSKHDGFTQKWYWEG